MKKALASLALFATLAATVSTAQAQTTRCQWEGYGQFKQWVCRQG